MASSALLCERIAPPAKFEIHVEPDREAGRVAPVGELDIATAPMLYAAVVDLVSAGFEVVVDLRDLMFIDCSGLRVLLRLEAAAGRDGWRLSLVQGPPAVSRVFALTRTLDALPFAVDERRR